MRLAVYIIAIILSGIFFIPQIGMGAFFLKINQWWLCILIRTFLFSFLLCPLIEIIGVKYNFLDIPDKRKIHDVPIPRIGGMAVYLSLMLVAVRYIPFYHELIALIAGASVIFFVGMVDDMKGMSTKTKLAGQIIAASILILSGIRINFVPHMPFEIFFEVIITFIWLIGITNAINFLDGINGLASGMGALCALLFLALTWGQRQDGLVLITVALAGGCLGFLPYNFKFWRKNRRASLFLGDEGSTLIGFLLAGIAVMGSWANNNPVVALSTPLLILGIPIFDMIYTTISRVCTGKVHTVKEWLDYVGKDHFHHRLINLGLSQKVAVFFILSLNLCLGLSSIIILKAGVLGAILLLTQAFIIFMIIVILMVMGSKNNHACQKEE